MPTASGSWSNPCRSWRRFPSRAVATLGLLGVTACAPAAPPPPVLWAWDRPEDLTFLAPGEATVAALVATVELTPGGPRVTPRRGALGLPRGVDVLAVVRLEAPVGTADNPDGAAVVADAIAAQLPPGDGALQLDFDATSGQRPFYRALLARLARPGRPLSITALASWCQGDPWLADLPITTAVPMLYRMGPDGPAIRAAFAREGGLRDPRCRRDLGLSDDEPRPPRLAGARPWLFSRRPWTRARFDAFRAALERAELSSSP